MSIFLNGNEYQASDFTGIDGRGYQSINPDTGLPFFPESVFTDMLAEIASSLASYDVSLFVEGIPSASNIVFRFVAVRAVTFADDFAGSDADAQNASTGTVVFDVQKNDVSVGSITFTTSKNGVFVTSGGSVSLAVGDVLKVIAPASPDATLDDIAITFKG